MKFRYNVFNFVTAMIFVLAFLCLMISYASEYLFYPTFALFSAGFVMLSIRLIKNYVVQKDSEQESADAIVMELARTDDGETYVMQDEKKDKKLRKKIKKNRLDKLMPIILCIICALIFAYMLVSCIITAI